MVRQGHLIAMVRAFLMGCAVLLMVVGCAGVRSGALQEEQARPDRCEGTRTINLAHSASAPAALFITNDVPGCPNKGGLLSGTDKPDKLDGDDEVRGLGTKDTVIGGSGSDVIYGGTGGDLLYGMQGDDVLYEGDGDDFLAGGKGEDVIYGGDGNDHLVPSEDGERDKLHCSEGKDKYVADKLDNVSSSCEVKTTDVHPWPSPDE